MTVRSMIGRLARGSLGTGSLAMSRDARRPNRPPVFGLSPQGSRLLRLAGQVLVCLSFCVVALWPERAGAEQWIESWSPEPRRWFLASKVDVGYAFFRPRFSVGYGKPHKTWTGFDINPLVSTSSGGIYSGGRIDTRYVEFRSGVLYMQSFNLSLLVPREFYDRRDINTRFGGNAEYLAWDSELEFKIPLDKLIFKSETQFFVLIGFPDDSYVFVDPLQVVMAPDFAFRQKFSLSFPMTAPEGLVLGPAIEPVWVPGRGEDSWIFRAGLTVHWPLYDDLELRTDLLPVVAGPDALGRAGAHFLEVKLRWYWATN